MELAAIGTAVMAADDSSPGPGGSRRPGNLWTVQAREDMFRRREAGEGWETICQVSYRSDFKYIQKASSLLYLGGAMYPTSSRCCCTFFLSRCLPPPCIYIKFLANKHSIPLTFTAGLPQSITSCYATTVFSKSMVDDHVDLV